MTRANFQWEEYYQKLEGRTPRPIVIDVLGRFASEPVQRTRKAIDLGCGDGTESMVLLEHGWSVLAIDGHPEGIARLVAKLPSAQQARLQTQVAKFEEVVLFPADLILACFSIPFCEPEYFNDLWDKLTKSLAAGGRFAGQFFGVRDSWAVNTNMTFHTEEQLRTMLANYEIEVFNEEEEEGHSTAGPKHWHIFTVVAKKR